MTDLAEGWDAWFRRRTEDVERVKALAEQEARDVRARADRLVEDARAWTASAKKPASAIPLRGPVSPESPPAHSSRTRYLADLDHAEQVSGMTTCVDAACKQSRINAFPASNLATQPMALSELQARMTNLASGGAVDLGPRVTFRKDRPGAPSTDRPLTTPTARMIAAAFLKSGLDSININSTTGGVHSEGSRHYRGLAVDANQVNGRPVRDPAAWPDVTAFQGALARQSNIRENFGPQVQDKTLAPGQPPVAVPSVATGHRHHVHASGQR